MKKYKVHNVLQRYTKKTYVFMLFDVFPSYVIFIDSVPLWCDVLKHTKYNSPALDKRLNE